MQVIFISIEDLKQVLLETIKQGMMVSSLTKSANADNKPLTLEEASKFLQMPKNTLYKYTHERSIPFHKIGRSLRFNQKDLMEWLESNRKLTRTEIEDQAMSELSKRKRR